MIIDLHHHLIAEDDYVDGLLRAMDATGVDQVCLSGLGVPSGGWLPGLTPTNDDVAAAMHRHPERIIGFGVIRLGDDPPERIAQLHDAGFRGIKTTRPRADYDDPRFDEHYALAERLGMPVLFHTGMILPSPADRRDDVSSARCRPVRLDRVARTFPELKMVMAHLGMPWHEEAAQMCRFHPNVYVDLSGSQQGWRNRKAPSFFADLFWWPGALDKIVFGSDVHWRELASARGDHERILDLLNITDETRAAIFGGTASRLIGLEGAS
ncbi:amidohydrolase family protein [Micromonospora sp. MS34]|uniref:amidohydrolase family protein n=1 Tax=Micromonospora sp. MS34 TaxID=3385971 RepID=UPI0039A1F087